MRVQNKNILIAVLVVIVLIMAVGYAAFATQLNINGTAEITSKWDVKYKLPTGSTAGTKCTLNTAGASASTCGMTVTIGTGAGANPTVPTGEITYSSDRLTATLGATLIQPGDTVQYVLTPHNYGTLAAVADDPIITIAETSQIENANALTGGTTELQVGQIKWSVSFTGKTSVGADADDNNITVAATYVQPADSAVVGPQSASVNVAIVYSQA